MNITEDLVLAFQQLRDAAWNDDHVDGQTRSAVAFACRTYEDLVAGKHHHYERPVTDEQMAGTIDEKLFYAFAMADEKGLNDVADGIVKMRLALGLRLMWQSNGEEPVYERIPEGVPIFTTRYHGDAYGTGGEAGPDTIDPERLAEATLHTGQWLQATAPDGTVTRYHWGGASSTRMQAVPMP